MAKRATSKKSGSKEGLRLAAFEVAKFDIDSKAERVAPLDDVEFNVETVIGQNRDGSKLVVEFNIVGYSVNHQDKRGGVIVTMLTHTYFDIVDADDFLKNGTIPDHFIATMLIVAYGTTRGTLCTRTAGTPQAGLLLPITTVRNLLSGIAIQDNQGWGI